VINIYQTIMVIQFLNSNS